MLPQRPELVDLSPGFPGGVRIPNGAFLQVQMLSIVANQFNLHYHVLRLDGTPETGDYFFSSTANDASLTVQRFGLPEGWLISAEVGPGPSYTTRMGQQYVTLNLVANENGVVIQHLACGYVTNRTPVQFPETHVQQMLPGDQAPMLAVVGSDPAAGAEFSLTVPTNLAYELLGVKAALTCSGVAATRRPSLVIDDGATVVYQLPAGDTITAGLTRTFFWGENIGQTTSVDNIVRQNMPGGLMLTDGWRVRSITSALDAGDDYAAPVLLVRRYICD